jgi:hypothetical protein
MVNVKGEPENLHSTSLPGADLLEISLRLTPVRPASGWMVSGWVTSEGEAEARVQGPRGEALGHPLESPRPAVVDGVVHVKHVEHL